MRLPTGRQVVLCFLANLTKNDIDKGVTYRDAANATVQQILPFYQRARIPTIVPNKMAEKIEKLRKEMININKANCNTRSIPRYKKQIEEFKAKLDKTIQFWPRNVLRSMTNREDRAFLISMMGYRMASMG